MLATASCPPRIYAKPEEMARVALRVKPKRKFFDQSAHEHYRYTDCGRPVNYPEPICTDCLCKECHAATK